MKADIILAFALSAMTLAMPAPPEKRQINADDYFHCTVELCPQWMHCGEWTPECLTVINVRESPSLSQHTEIGTHIEQEILVKCRILVQTPNCTSLLAPFDGEQTRIPTAIIEAPN